MRRGVVIGAACVIALCSSILSSQTPTPRRVTESPSASARAAHAVPNPIIDSLVAKLGGIERLQSLDDWFVEGSGRENTTGELQGISSEAPTWRPHEERVAVVLHPNRVAWERNSPRNDSSVRYRRFIYGDDSSGFHDFIGGYGRLTASPASVATRIGIERRIPHLLVKEIATGGGECSSTPSVGGGRSTGRSRQSVDLECLLTADGTRVVLTVDRARYVITGMAFDARIPGERNTRVLWEWTGWHADAEHGVAPGGHRITLAGRPFQEVTYRSYRAGAASARALVSLPPPTAAATNGVMAFPGAGPATGLVAPGVRIVSVGGFNVLIAEFRDFLVLVDAPETHPGFQSIPAAGGDAFGRVTTALLDQLHQIAPTKPLRYVVVTHHHSDHLGGLGGVADAGTTVLTTPNEQRAVRRALDAWVSDTTQPHPATIETVRDRKVITDGEMVMEVRNVGANPHTAANLMVWLPQSQIAFQGDLFYFGENDPFPPSGRGKMNVFFAEWLRKEAIAPRAIYGVHNSGAAGPDAVRHSLPQAPTTR